MLHHLKDKVGLITGGASGIGKVFASYLAEQGARVVIVDIQQEAGESVANELRNKGYDAHFLHVDVTQEEEHLRLMDYLSKHYETLDFACNNAGIEQKPSKMIDVEVSIFERIVNVNLKGVWLGMKHQIRHMLKQGKGTIVNTASVAGVRAVSDIGIYNATKAGVIMLTRTAALEYASQGIRVNSISPGLIETEMALRMKAEHPGYYQSSLVDVIPMKRPGSPLEVAKALAFLCDEGTEFITGHNLVIDGGWLA
jgi:NAD(P)-dependent dehydrogenase (short-subunit alcohol dehydrogenase family)